jgi:hypothetical protein
MEELNQYPIREMSMPKHRLSLLMIRCLNLSVALWSVMISCGCQEAAELLKGAAQVYQAVHSGDQQNAALPQAVSCGPECRNHKVRFKNDTDQGIILSAYDSDSNQSIDIPVPARSNGGTTRFPRGNWSFRWRRATENQFYNLGESILVNCNQPCWQIYFSGYGASMERCQ